jgi:hypothetical protein
MTAYAGSQALAPMYAYEEDDDGSNAYEARVETHRDVAQELYRLRVRKFAAEQFKAENEPEAPRFDAGTLGEILARPADPPMRVDGLIPWDSSALLVAQRKTGKTTMLLNYARSLLRARAIIKPEVPGVS